MTTAATASNDRPERYIRRMRAAVERLLASSSFTSLSVEDIIQEAGIARSTFYVYFSDKGQMLNAFTADLLDEALVAVSAWWDLPPTADYGALRGALAGFVRFFHQHSALLNAVIDASAYDEGVREPGSEEGFARMVRAGEVGIAEHIRAGQRAGSVTSDLEPEVVARWLVRLVEQGLYELTASADEARLERQIDAISMVVWNTLYRGSRAVAVAGGAR
jgi:AcrR family transcriptional regulator